MSMEETLDLVLLKYSVAPPVKEATLLLFKRYLEIISKAQEKEGFIDPPLPNKTTVSHAKWMCNTALTIGVSSTWPEDKLSRWLGFVQAILAVHNLISVDEERSISRRLFHTAYEVQGTAIPETVEPKTEM